MNMSKNAPVAPSARNQFNAGAVTPALSWPAPNGSAPLVMYIARSTTIGCVDVIAAETSVAASDWPLITCVSTAIVKRLLPATT